MDTFPSTSEQIFTPLPIDSTRGFPQSFPFQFGERTYQFWFYVNVAANQLQDKTDFIPLPTQEAFLVVRVERENADGTRETIFLRKVVPNLEYETENIVLTFPQQQISRSNLNGQGNFGSQVTGGIAQRWV